MKKLLASGGFVAFSILLVLTLSGCANFKPLVKTVDTLRAATTNAVTVWQTNAVAVTNYTTNIVILSVAKTNDAGVVTPAVVQPTVVPLITVSAVVTASTNFVITPGIYQTNYAVDPMVETVVKGAGAAAAPFTGGISGMAAGGLLVLSHLVMGFLNRRNQKKAQAALNGEEDAHSVTTEVLADAQTAVSTLVANIADINSAVSHVYPNYTQAGAGGAPSICDRVMQNVQRVQQLAGIHDVVKDALNDHDTAVVAPAKVGVNPTA